MAKETDKKGKGRRKKSRPLSFKAEQNLCRLREWAVKHGLDEFIKKDGLFSSLRSLL